MNTVVALPIAAAIPTTAPAMPPSTDTRAFEAYASWLHMERRILCHELWPHMGAEADKFVWGDNAGYDWHFRGRGDLAWNEGPQPSSRAAAVLDLVGVDWRQPKEDLGLDHTDNGARPRLPSAWPRCQARAAIERHRKAVDDFQQTYDALDCAELEAAEQHGRRPSGLIAWRDYSAIGGSEIERMRDRLLQDPNEDREVVESEHRKAKARERQAYRAQAKWDQRAGLVALRQRFETISGELALSEEELASVRPASVADSAELLDYASTNLGVSIADPWAEPAIGNVKDFLSALAQRNGEAVAV